VNVMEIVKVTHGAEYLQEVFWKPVVIGPNHKGKRF